MTCSAAQEQLLGVNMFKPATSMRFLYGITALTVLQACAVQKSYPTAEVSPVNCATANSDLQMLRSEKDLSKLAATPGGKSIAGDGTDAHAVISEQKVQAGASADYEAALDKRISAIKRGCQPLLLGSVR
jgi:hypothetical protein